MAEGYVHNHIVGGGDLESIDSGWQQQPPPPQQPTAPPQQPQYAGWQQQPPPPPAAPQQHGLAPASPTAADGWYNPATSPAAVGGAFEYVPAGHVPNMTRSTTMESMAFDGEEDYSQDPPLLEELDINFKDILHKTMQILQPFASVDAHLVTDSDLTGPLLFFMCLGFCLLLSGKALIGFIYGYGLFGCVSIYTLLNLMNPTDRRVGIWCVMSTLGYCLLPVVILSLLGIVFTLTGVVGNLLSLVAVVWCTSTSTRLFERALGMEKQRVLIAYPIGLLYSCFVLITMF